MLKLTLAVWVAALAGAASADEWRSLRVDASSDAAFERSLAAFKDELSPEQRQEFGDALKDIWRTGTSERGRYRAADYYRQIHGLSYEEVVNFTTGETAKLRRQAAAAPTRPAAAPRRFVPSYIRSPWEGVPGPLPTFAE